MTGRFPTDDRFYLVTIRRDREPGAVGRTVRDAAGRPVRGTFDEMTALAIRTLDASPDLAEIHVNHHGHLYANLKNGEHHQ